MLTFLLLYEIAFVSRNEVLHAHCIATATSRPFVIAFCYLLFTLATMSKNVISSVLNPRAWFGIELPLECCLENDLRGMIALSTKVVL